MEEPFFLVCDRCFAYRPFTAAARCTPDDLRGDAALGAFVVEHEQCRPPLRVSDVTDPAVEGYREHYEEA